MSVFFSKFSNPQSGAFLPKPVAISSCLRTATEKAAAMNLRVFYAHLFFCFAQRSSLKTMQWSLSKKFSTSEREKMARKFFRKLLKVFFRTSTPMRVEPLTCCRFKRASVIFIAHFHFSITMFNYHLLYCHRCQVYTIVFLIDCSLTLSYSPSLVVNWLKDFGCVFLWF